MQYKKQFTTVLINKMECLKLILSCIQTDGSQSSDALLEESQEAKLKKLRISNLTPGMILLATDEGRKRDKQPACMSPLFSFDGTYDQNRACDAVLIKKVNDGYQVCYIELKSDSPSGYEGQFKSTQCFIRYVSEISKTLCCKPMNITKERFVVFHTDSKNAARHGVKIKTKFSPGNANTPSSPAMFCVRNGDEIRYSQFF